MHHFFAEPSQIAGDTVCIRGADVNHMKNVLRIRPGEEILLSDGEGTDLRCRVESLEAEQVTARVLERFPARGELPARLWLFQGLPKSDKMEVIIQKAVELGAAAIVPVATKNAVVKLDKRRGEAKLSRWQAIAESAAKQSKRSRLPRVREIMSFREALAFVEQENFALRLIPYEAAEGMEASRRAFSLAAPGMDIAVFIGPEGGFDEEEIRLAQEKGLCPISLGSRILRTETAGPAVLSLLMMRLEGGI